MSRRATEYADGWLRVKVSGPHMQRAMIRLARQGVSGLEAVGKRVRQLVIEAGGYARRGRGRSLLEERGRAESARRMSTLSKKHIKTK